jgi:hypothetical protein
LGSAMPVVIKNSSRSSWPGQSVMAPASSIPAAGVLGCLKRAEKSGKYQRDIDLEPDRF